MAEKLKKYNEKRDFSKTKEPAGKAKPCDQKELRFVVQHHMARRDHYDFRLEWDGVFLSWAVPKGPSYNPKDKRLAVHVEDHPFDYKDFEGSIPQGEYGGGTVMLWDEGNYLPVTDMRAGLKGGSLKFVLNGARLKGGWTLVKFKNESDDNWLLIKEKDEFAKEEDGISGKDTSVRSGRTMAEIAGDQAESKKNPFSEVSVQLAKLTDRIPSGKNWLFEVKYDGYRIVAFAENGKARLMSRNGKDYSDRFPAIVSALEKWTDGRAMVLDGELVVSDKSGKTDFQALQNFVKTGKGGDLTYMVFDLLALKGEDFRGRPLSARKDALAELMKKAPKNLRFSSYVAGKGKESFAAAEKLGLEGIVGKKADSLYSGTRNGDWIKIKCDYRQEFVIGGYTETEDATSGMSALLLGYYEGKKLIYAGRAGTGFTEQTKRELVKAFKTIKRETPAFYAPPKVGGGESLYWLEPKLVAEIKFAEWTEEGVLRQASFKGLRADKLPKETVRENADK